MGMSAAHSMISNCYSSASNSNINIAPYFIEPVYRMHPKVACASVCILYWKNHNERKSNGIAAAQTYIWKLSTPSNVCAFICLSIWLLSISKAHFDFCSLFPSHIKYQSCDEGGDIGSKCNHRANNIPIHHSIGESETHKCCWHFCFRACIRHTYLIRQCTSGLLYWSSRWQRQRRRLLLIDTHTPIKYPSKIYERNDIGYDIGQTASRKKNPSEWNEVHANLCATIMYALNQRWIRSRLSADEQIFGYWLTAIKKRKKKFATIFILSPSFSRSSKSLLLILFLYVVLAYLMLSLLVSWIDSMVTAYKWQQYRIHSTALIWWRHPHSHTHRMP